MAGIQSIQRNLAAEDAAVARELAGEGGLLDDPPTATRKEAEEAAMNIMAARDVIVNGSAPAAAPKTEAPEPTAKSRRWGLADRDSQAPSPKPQAVKAGTLAKLATAAALVAGGAGAGAGVPWLLGAFQKPAAVSPAPANAGKVGVSFQVIPPSR